VLRQVLRSTVGGFFMGTADLVPGVSGGTIALVLGIYQQLVASIRQGSSALGSMIKADFAGFKRHSSNVEWRFLLPLLTGILLAVVLLASFLERQLEERPVVIAGLFLGLVLGSIAIAWRLLRKATWRHVVIAAIVGLGLFVALGFGEGQVRGDPSALAFFGAGVLAICAMILPGISGSLILLMLGMYAPVLAAVTDREFGTIIVFALGAVIGLALFSQLLYWLLEHHHDNVLAVLIGLMAGSARILWPWPDGVGSAEIGAPGDDWLSVVVAMAIGAVAVSLIGRLGISRESVASG
jgi:putative membrane protein